MNNKGQQRPDNHKKGAPKNTRHNQPGQNANRKPTTSKAGADPCADK